jgi:RHS repeat-associated protein
MEYNVGGTEVWQFNIQSDGSVKGEITYPANSLYSNLTTSERGFWTKELKDKQGRVIAKMQQLNIDDVATTAYCYNDLTGNLAYVIPPEAYKKFGTGTGQVTSFQESDEIFKELCFGYHFDSKNRQNEKHVPGGGWRYSVFDKHDREVMFADDADKAKGYWQFRKFDALGREIQSGILNGKGSTTRATLQTAFDGHNANSYETTGTDLLGYTNVSFPTGYEPVDADVMSVSHYDDYVWQTETAYNFDALTAFHTQGLTKGMMTGMLSRNIETNDWLKTVNYFDYRGKLIQSFFKNHKGNIERSETQYQFNGDVLKMNIDHEGNTETYDYEIDHISRKKSFKHTLNGTLKNVSRYEYDDLGRLKTKKLSPFTTLGTVASGSWNNTNTWQNNGLPSINDYIKINAGHTVTIDAGEAGSAGSLYNAGTLNTYGQLKLGVLPPNTSGATELQTVDYSYQIRGLRGVNLDASGNLTNKLFSMKLSYETAGFWDGNIGKQEWKSSLDNVTRSFTYGYDGSSRIKSGIFASDKVGENYSLNNVTYDFNGNITNLSRNGWKSDNSFGLVDNLNYTYNVNSNKILKVDDASNETASFRDVSGNAYTYWEDGSLKSDVNKGITEIQYNYLKRQRKITFSNGKVINYQCDVRGKKLKEIASNGDVTDYLGNIIKKNGVLYQISHDEGRIVNGIYEYNITDHLGNLRVAFKDSLGIAKIIQSNAYGAWGEDLPTLRYINSLKINNFGYLNREFQIETGCTDLVNRQFDNIIGRFTSIDPITDGQEHLSLYQYGWNNPVLRSDPNGDCPNCVTAGIGAGIGGVLGGGIEIATQIYKNGSVTDWKAVGGSALQGFVTGGAAGFTGGASLLATAGVSAGANVVGGAINNSIQGKENTVQSVAIDATVGAVAGAGGKLIGNALAGSSAAVSAETQTVYRGVNSTSPAFSAAESGVVKPRGGLFGHSNAATHNSGANGTANSKLTSWTTNPDVATNYALRTSGNGVVLSQQVPKWSILTSPNTKTVQLIQGGGRVSESEVLLKGTQRNLTVQKIGQ